MQNVEIRAPAEGSETWPISPLKWIKESGLSRDGCSKDAPDITSFILVTVCIIQALITKDI